MPFTFSHPAIILPLVNKRKGLSATGLIIGSIIPDFESFIFLREYKIYGHTWKGMFWFDLPLAIIVSFIFHGIVRNSLVKNLPDFLSSKFIGVMDFKWGLHFRKHILIVIGSMLIGIFSHLLLDGITHLNLLYPDSRNSTIYFHSIQLYVILQYASSVIGIVIAAWYVMALPDQEVKKHSHSKNRFYIGREERTTNKAVYWIILMIVACTFTGLAIHYSTHYYMGIILIIEVCISGLLAGLILTPVFQSILLPAK